MRRLAAGLPLSLALLAPATAHAVPKVQTDRTCYLQTAKTNVTVSGNGWAPNTPYDIFLDDTKLGGNQSVFDRGGAFQGVFAPPSLADDELQRQFAITVQSGPTKVATHFTVTRLKADFAPATGDPRKLRVRFSVAGFGLNAASPSVYVHYIDPKGKLQQSVRLGTATGQCGRIVKTAKRRLFPFTVPAVGKWQLQFDTRRSFRKGVKGSKFLFYSVGVCLQPPGAPKPTKTNPCPQTVKR